MNNPNIPKEPEYVPSQEELKGLFEGLRASVLLPKVTLPRPKVAENPEGTTFDLRLPPEIGNEVLGSYEAINMIVDDNANGSYMDINYFTDNPPGMGDFHQYEFSRVNKQYNLRKLPVTSPDRAQGADEFSFDLPPSSEDELAFQGITAQLEPNLPIVRDDIAFLERLLAELQNPRLR